MALKSYRDGTTPPIPIGFPWPRPQPSRPFHDPWLETSVFPRFQELAGGWATPLKKKNIDTLLYPFLGSKNDTDFSAPPCPSDFFFVGMIGHPMYMEKYTWCSKPPASLNKNTMSGTTASNRNISKADVSWYWTMKFGVSDKHQQKLNYTPQTFPTWPHIITCNLNVTIISFCPISMVILVEHLCDTTKKIEEQMWNSQPICVLVAFLRHIYIYSGVEQTKITAKRNKHLVPKSARNTWDFQTFLRSGQAARTTKEMWTSAVELWVP